MKVLVVSVVELATAVVVAVSGNYALDLYQGRDYVAPQSFELATVHPEFGKGIPTTLQNARITRDGQFQVVVSGGQCAALSGLDVHPTETTIEVSARITSVPAFDWPGGENLGCTMEQLAWWANAALDEPLDGRTVTDTRSGFEFKVSDCRGLPADTKGPCWDLPDPRLSTRER